MTQQHRGCGYLQDPLAGIPSPSDLQRAYVIDTMADMRAFDFSRMADGQVFWLKGYYEIGDGGGGWFNFYRDGSATDNGGTIIVPTDGVGYLGRILTGAPISVKWFGARGNGSQDDRDYIQAAIDAGAGGAIYFPITSSYYKINSGLLLPVNTALVGEYPRVTGEDPNTAGVQIRTGSNTAFDMISTVAEASGDVWGVTIKDLALYGNGLNTRAITIGTQSISDLAYDNVIDGVSVRACRTGIQLNRPVRSVVRNTRLNGANLTAGFGINVYFAQGCVFEVVYVADYQVNVAISGQQCNFNDCNIAFALPGISNAVNLLLITQAYSHNFQNCVFENLASSAGAIKEVFIYEAPGDTLNTTDITFTNCIWNGTVPAATHVEIGAAAADSVKKVQFINCSMSNNVATNVLFTNAEGTEFEDTYRVTNYDGVETTRPVTSGTDTKLRYDDINGIQLVGAAQILSGTGTPQGNVAAAVGSTFQRTDGGAGASFYVKETGAATNLGWVAK